MNIKLHCKQIEIESLEEQFQNKWLRIETKIVTDSETTVSKVTCFLFNIPVFRFYRNQHKEDATQVYQRKESKIIL